MRRHFHIAFLEGPKRLWMGVLTSLILLSSGTYSRAQDYACSATLCGPRASFSSVPQNEEWSEALASADSPSSVDQARSLMGVNSWAYQLQNIDISQIANNRTFDLIVIDYSADGSDQEKFTPEHIGQIKASGKKVIAYISIGEAEEYRFYWNESWDADHDGIPDPGAPAWLASENPDWEGNYKVRFWYSSWQNIVFSYIDTLYAQGFDGIYLDIIDAYYYWTEENPEEPLADSLMIQFVLNIRDHVSELTDGDFFILPQNGEFIIEEANVSDDLKAAYLGAIQGIGVEDVFFPGDLDENNPFVPDGERIEVLQEYIRHGINVFSIEYLTDPGLIEQYLVAIEQYHFVPYVTVRALDRLHDGIPVSVEDNEHQVPQSCMLSQNYPNPFNPVTTIAYSLPQPGDVTLTIYTIAGQRVQVLVEAYQEAGHHTLRFDGSGFANGVYLYRLEAGSFVERKRMVCLK